jgi:hypothetical protein
MTCITVLEHSVYVMWVGSEALEHRKKLVLR